MSPSGLPKGSILEGRYLFQAVTEFDEDSLLPKFIL